MIQYYKNESAQKLYEEYRSLSRQAKKLYDRINKLSAEIEILNKNKQAAVLVATDTIEHKSEVFSKLSVDRVLTKLHADRAKFLKKMKQISKQSETVINQFVKVVREDSLSANRSIYYERSMIFGFTASYRSPNPQSLYRKVKK
jgi:CMP-2-keto-3-deoxyoctulosonic acid synthetase